jgi:hypothetical protein
LHRLCQQLRKRRAINAQSNNGYSARSPAVGTNATFKIHRTSARPAGSSRLNITLISRAGKGGVMTAIEPIAEMAVARVGGRLLGWSCRHCGIRATRGQPMPHYPRTEAEGPRGAPVAAPTGSARAPSGRGGRSSEMATGAVVGVGCDPGARVVARHDGGAAGTQPQRERKPQPNGKARLGSGNRALSSGKRDGGAATRIYNQRSTGNMTKEINNPQQSWGFEWEPPKAVMKDSGTRDWTLWGGKLQLQLVRNLRGS